MPEFVATIAPPALSAARGVVVRMASHTTAGLFRATWYRYLLSSSSQLVRLSATCAQTTHSGLVFLLYFTYHFQPTEV